MNRYAFAQDEDRANVPMKMFLVVQAKVFIIMTDLLSPCLFTIVHKLTVDTIIITILSCIMLSFIVRPH